MYSGKDSMVGAATLPRFQEKRPVFSGGDRANADAYEDEEYYDDDNGNANDDYEYQDDGGKDVPRRDRYTKKAESSHRFMEARAEEGSTMQAQTGVAVMAQAGAAAGDTSEAKQLDTALGEIKDQIVKDSEEIHREVEWTKDVDNLIETYAKKRTNVKKNVMGLRDKVKQLLVKKREVQNLQLQKALESKLNDANSDMGTLETALQHVQDKETSFSKTRNSLKETIKKLSTALTELKGGAGEAGGEEGGASAAASGAAKGGASASASASASGAASGAGSASATGAAKAF